MAKRIIGSIVIALAVYGLWCSLELLYYGEIQTREVDSWMALILIVSLNLNYQFIVRDGGNNG